MTQRGLEQMGWLPGYPDFRDFSPDHSGPAPEGEPRVTELLQAVGVDQPMEGAKLGASVDLSERFPPVEDQGDLGSCTANAGVGLLEYFERNASGEYIDASRLFLYKATRNLLGWTGDQGAFIRTTMKAMALFGVPPEEYWPYDIEKFEDEPTAFCYSFGQNYKALQYYRLDPADTTATEVLVRLKTHLNARLPAMFGFTVYTSYDQSWNNGGAFPYPTEGERIEGGHAVVAVGYDEDKEITNAFGGEPTRGAIRIRNSWGAGWGEDGYGWLPFAYVRQGLADDWWSLIKSSWTSAKAFGPDQ